MCLGGAMFGYPSLGCDEPAARSTFATYRDGGGNFVDTADAYGDGASEAIVGRLLRGCRDDFVLATKVGDRMGSGPNSAGLSRRHIVRASWTACAAFRPTPSTYAGFTPSTLGRRSTRLTCVSATARFVLSAARTSRRGVWPGQSGSANPGGTTGFASAQLRYSLLSREIEREHLERTPRRDRLDPARCRRAQRKGRDG
jgi:hypothetical protein